MTVRIIERTRYGRIDESRVIDLPNLSVEAVRDMLAGCSFVSRVTEEMAIAATRKLMDLHAPYQHGWTDWVRVPVLDNGKA